MLAYFFPPEGNAGAHRPLRFLRHLPAIGWRPTILTVQTGSYERYDPDLLARIPPDVHVIRTRNPDPWRAFQAARQRLMRKHMEHPPDSKSEIRPADQSRLRSGMREIVRMAEACLYHPDPERGWISGAVKAGLRYCAQERPAVIWATAGPVSCFVAAEKLSALTGLPYVLDFRDSWTITQNDFEDRRPAWAKNHEERRMYRLLAKARSLIFRFDAEAECYCRVYKGAVDPAKVHIIPNGYEGLIEEFVPPQTDRCEILYTGTVSDYRYDTLLDALCSLKASSPELARRVNFKFVGEGSEQLSSDASRLNLAEIVTTQSPTSQENIARMMKQAHCLLILGRRETMRGFELFAGAKLFGYLKAGMPILGVLPDDETRKVLVRIGIRTIAPVASPAEIIVVLRSLLQAFSEGTLSSLVPDANACKSYSAEKQTAELARALEGSPAAESFVPGSVPVPASLQSEVNRTRSFSGRRGAASKNIATAPV